MLQPTREYERYDLALTLHKTVRELLTGQAGPLMGMEAYLWRRFWIARHRLQSQSAPTARRG